MIRKVVVIFSSGLFLLCLGLWLAQLTGPIAFCDGPVFRDADWVIGTGHDGPNWYMHAPKGEKDVYSKTFGGQFPFRAIEVPANEAPPMDPLLPDDSLLLGIGYGHLLLGQAYFHDVPNPATPPAPGMVYVCSTHIAVSIPFWLLILIFAAYPTITFIHGPYRRHRRRKKGLCLNCGYNLTGNVSGICPECGEKIVTTK